MRLATVIASSYNESAQLAGLPSALNGAQLIQQRLGAPETGLLVRRLSADRDLPEQLQRTLDELPAPPTSILVYFSGYLAQLGDRPPALVLNAPRLRAYSLIKLCGLLRERTATSFVLLDAVPMVDEGRTLHQVADAVGDAFDEHLEAVGGLLGMNAPASVSNQPRSDFCLLVLQSLEWLRTVGGPGTPVTVKDLFQLLSLGQKRLGGLEAIRYYPTANDFVLFAGGTQASLPPQADPQNSHIAVPVGSTTLSVPPARESGDSPQPSDRTLPPGRSSAPPFSMATEMRAIHAARSERIAPPQESGSVGQPYGQPAPTLSPSGSSPPGGQPPAPYGSGFAPHPGLGQGSAMASRPPSPLTAVTPTPYHPSPHGTWPPHPGQPPQHGGQLGQRAHAGPVPAQGPSGPAPQYLQPQQPYARVPGWQQGPAPAGADPQHPAAPFYPQKYPPAGPNASPSSPQPGSSQHVGAQPYSQRHYPGGPQPAAPPQAQYQPAPPQTHQPPSVPAQQPYPGPQPAPFAAYQAPYQAPAPQHFTPAPYPSSPPPQGFPGQQPSTGLQATGPHSPAAPALFPEHAPAALGAPPAADPGLSPPSPPQYLPSPPAAAVGAARAALLSPPETDLRSSGEPPPVPVVLGVEGLQQEPGTSVPPAPTPEPPDLPEEPDGSNRSDTDITTPEPGVSEIEAFEAAAALIESAFGSEGERGELTPFPEPTGPQANLAPEPAEQAALTSQLESPEPPEQPAQPAPQDQELATAPGLAQQAEASPQPEEPAADPGPDPETVEGRLALGERAIGVEDHEGAIGHFGQALWLLGEGDPALETELHVKIGDALRRVGRPDQALAHYESALRIDPECAEALLWATEMLCLRGEFERVEDLHQRRLAALVDDHARAEVLEARVALWLDHAKDLRRGRQALEDLLIVRPGDVTLVERLIAILDSLGEDAEAVNERHELGSRLTDDPERAARHLFDAAVIAREKLRDRDLAVELGQQAIRTDPHQFAALELVAALLAENLDWSGLADVYEEVLGRLADEQAIREVAMKLGTLYRQELDSPRAAAEAFEKALALDPHNPALHLELVRLYTDTVQPERAMDRCTLAIRLDPRNTEAYHFACELFARAGKPDQAWAAAAVLDLLGEADINESLLAETHRPDGLLPVQSTVEEAHWQAKLFYPERSFPICRVLDLIVDPAIDYRLATLTRERKLFVPDPSLRQDPASSTTMLSRSLTWTSRLLGIPAPDLYVYPAVKGEMTSTPAATPTALVSKSLGSGLSLQQLAFLWGRHLTFFRPEHYVLVYYPTVQELAALVLAAFVATDFTPRKVRFYDRNTKKLAGRLHRKLAPERLAELKEVTSELSLASAGNEMLAWARSIELAAGRAGLLACGDIGIARDMIERYPVGGQTSPFDQVSDLMRFSVSDQYAELRRHLGISVKS